VHDEQIDYPLIGQSIPGSKPVEDCIGAELECRKVRSTITMGLPNPFQESIQRVRRQLVATESNPVAQTPDFIERWSRLVPIWFQALRCQHIDILAVIA
jgi:hypothetical protein